MDRELTRAEFMEAIAAAARQHMTDAQALRVHRAFSTHPQRAANLLSVVAGGQQITGREMAEYSLQVAAQIEREGGQLSS